MKHGRLQVVHVDRRFFDVVRVIVGAPDGAAGTHAAFDRILIDAPCSATGTIRKHPDVAWTKGPEDIRKLTALQAKLLDKAASLLKSGGRLVYCTCSLEPEEAEMRARGFETAVVFGRGGGTTDNCGDVLYLSNHYAISGGSDSLIWSARSFAAVILQLGRDPLLAHQALFGSIAKSTITSWGCHL